jgi:spectinomycin phosphotransferase
MRVSEDPSKRAFMINKPIQEQEIIELLKIHYGIDVQDTHVIAGGADINAFVYKVDSKFHSYFVKFKYGDHDEINLSIISLLYDSGIEEIIFPIHTLEGQSSQQLDRFRIIVYPFIDAPNGFTKKLTKEQWIKLGTALRKIHDTSVPPIIRKQIRQETYSAKWRKMVRALYTKIESDTSGDQITSDFTSFFIRNIDKIGRLVDGAEQLSNNIKPDSDKYVLCHSDIHAGNILVTNDDSIYIIDWDEPMLGPKERDLMFIGGGVGNVWNNPQEIYDFYEGYGKPNIDKTILSYYRHERIVEDLALFGRDLLSDEQSNQSRLEMLKHFKDMFSPNGVVEIALSFKLRH